MAGVCDAIRIFALEHRGCGDLRYDAEPITPEGYAVCVSCLRREARNGGSHGRQCQSG